MDWKKYRKTQAFKERGKNIYRQVLRYIKNNPGKEITDIGQILGAVGIKEDK